MHLNSSELTIRSHFFRIVFSALISSIKDGHKRQSFSHVVHALLWLGLIIGTPISIISLHLWLERTYAAVPGGHGFLLMIVLALVHFVYMYQLRATLEKKINGLVSWGGISKDIGPDRTARAIALSIVLALTVMMALLILNFYGHYRATEYANRANSAMQNGSNPATASQIGSSAFNQSREPASISTPEGPDFLEVNGASLGTFGDFFGGIANPILTFGTLVALAITIFVQRRQLDVAEQNERKSSALVEKQTFETTFFNMIGLHNATVQDLRFNPAVVEIPVWYEDPEYFDTTLESEQLHDEMGLFAEMSDEVEPADAAAGDGAHDDQELEEDVAYDYQGDPDELVAPVLLSAATGREVFARVLELMNSNEHGSTAGAIYHRIQKYHNYVLGHYFRTLYQVLELVDEYSEQAGYNAATRYSSIIRAQLSAHELVLLIFNCGYNMVDNGEFRELLKRYKILEHIPLRLSSGRLQTPGYEFVLGYRVNQFLGRTGKTEDLAEEGGAFGRNPVIAEYLKKRSKLLNGSLSSDAVTMGMALRSNLSRLVLN